MNGIEITSPMQAMVTEAIDQRRPQLVVSPGEYVLTQPLEFAGAHGLRWDATGVVIAAIP